LKELRLSGSTHEVVNQPAPLQDYNAYLTDAALRSAVAREGAASASDRLEAHGATTGSAEWIARAFQANEIPRRLATHDHFGHRVARAEYHPAYHDLIRMAQPRTERPQWPDRIPAQPRSVQEPPGVRVDRLG
jgi:putative acyl-CoA dehydrogenase